MENNQGLAFQSIQPTQPTTPKSEKKQRKGKAPDKQKIIILILLVVVIVASGVLGYLYFKEKYNTSEAQIDRLIAEVSRKVKIPADEEPSVATVIDASKLKENNPHFYKEVKNGFKLIVYKDRVIIYDPDKELVINMLVMDTDDFLNTDEGTQNEGDTEQSSEDTPSGDTE